MLVTNYMICYVEIPLSSQSHIFDCKANYVSVITFLLITSIIAFNCNFLIIKLCSSWWKGDNDIWFCLKLGHPKPEWIIIIVLIQWLFMGVPHFQRSLSVYSVIFQIFMGAPPFSSIFSGYSWVSPFHISFMGVPCVISYSADLQGVFWPHSLPACRALVMGRYREIWEASSPVLVTIPSKWPCYLLVSLHMEHHHLGNIEVNGPCSSMFHITINLVIDHQCNHLVNENDILKKYILNWQIYQGVSLKLAFVGGHGWSGYESSKFLQPEQEDSSCFCRQHPWYRFGKKNPRNFKLYNWSRLMGYSWIFYIIGRIPGSRIEVGWTYEDGPCLRLGCGPQLSQKSQALSRDGLPFPWNGAVSGLFSGPDQTRRPCRSVAGRGAFHMKPQTPKKWLNSWKPGNYMKFWG